MNQSISSFHHQNNSHDSLSDRKDYLQRETEREREAERNGGWRQRQTDERQREEITSQKEKWTIAHPAPIIHPLSSDAHFAPNQFQVDVP